MVHEHHGLRGESLVDDFVRDGDRRLAQPRGDGAAQDEVLAEELGLAHLAAQGDRVVVPLPAGVGPHVLGRARPDAAVQGIPLPLRVRVGGADVLEPAGEEHAAHDAADHVVAEGVEGVAPVQAGFGQEAEADAPVFEFADVEGLVFHRDESDVAVLDLDGPHSGGAALLVADAASVGELLHAAYAAEDV